MREKNARRQAAEERRSGQARGWGRAIASNPTKRTPAILIPLRAHPQAEEKGMEADEAARAQSAQLEAVVNRGNAPVPLGL